MKVVEANGAAVTIKFGELSLEDLVAHHNEMCLTAIDLGLSGVTVETFASVQEGVAACERLHGAILKARERAAAPPKKQRASVKAKAKRAATETEKVKSAAASTPGIVAGYTEPTKEKTVAKKAKKAAGKKTAKKVAAKKSSGNGTRTRLSGDTKITWLAEGNPARKGSIFYDRVEKVRKAKTVEGITKAGGIAADATECAKRGWAKLSA
jgi:hypothetical protein